MPPVTVSHRIDSPRWTAPALRIVVLSDVHVVAPWTSLQALAKVVDRINGLGPDLVLLPGDFLADPKLPGRRAAAPEIAAVLEKLRAPLGVHATLGNHDWKDCHLARQTKGARNSMAEALHASAISYYENSAQAIGPFWLAGVDSTQGFGTTWAPKPRHDLGTALGQVPPGADVILMAHEPDLWVEERPEVALTVSGHTHGGQIALGGWRPLAPSRHGSTYAHGLHWDKDRALIVSGGLGYTGVPLRIGAPPEITVIDLRGRSKG